MKKAALLTGGLGLSSLLPPSVQRALAINPDIGSTFLDAEHVVFLMQENRSFDHAFGSLKGVRGFNDPRAIKLPNQYPVWLQSDSKGATYAPFRLDIKDTKATWMSALPHSWDDQVKARNNGSHDGWLEAKRSGNTEYAHMPLTLGYYNRHDIPFYYALADAFTVCDYHFCSMLTGTSPNRCFFWTGKIREEQNENSRAHLTNGQIDGSERVSWNTFPERLSAHNIDWKIYQNELSVGVLENEEDDWLGNFTDNTMEFFKQYNVRRHPEHLPYLKKLLLRLEGELKQKSDAKQREKLEIVKKDIAFLEANPLNSLSAEEQDLHKRAFVTNRNDPDYHSLDSISFDDNGTARKGTVPKGDLLHQFRSDVDAGRLPTVSWLVAPSKFSDHPGSPWYGTWYLSEAVDILTRNPEVWKKTIFILTYDENDGYFDHMPPFVPPDPRDASTGLISTSLDARAEYIYKNEDSEFDSPVGLGYRVPMVVVSPWSRGGYVNSQVFDHTSSIQFLEYFLSHKTGKKIFEDNISSWRRALCGDLTSVFRPYKGEKIPVPAALDQNSVVESIDRAQFAKVPDNYERLSQEKIASILKESVSSPYLPKQEPGIKPANSIPYELYTHGVFDQDGRKFRISFTAGTKVFGERSSAAGFLVYGHKKNWSFTVDAGDTVNYAWPLDTFPNQHYDLKVYGVNGFFRSYEGSINDPQISIDLVYPDSNDPDAIDDHVMLRVKRLVKGEKLLINVMQNSYGGADTGVLLEVDESKVLVPVSLKKSHYWYDFTLKVDKFPEFRQQFAGHVEQVEESFTDPLLGGVL